MAFGCTDETRLGAFWSCRLNQCPQRFVRNLWCPRRVAKATKEFFKRWGIRHGHSSTYHAQFNGRAEVTVKSINRLLQDNVSIDGSLNTDGVTQAMLQLCNMPERDTGVSPAQVLMGRPLRDTLLLESLFLIRTAQWTSDGGTCCLLKMRHSRFSRWKSWTLRRDTSNH